LPWSQFDRWNAPALPCAVGTERTPTKTRRATLAARLPSLGGTRTRDLPLGKGALFPLSYEEPSVNGTNAGDRLGACVNGSVRTADR
jgi:hypothetical protein